MKKLVIGITLLSALASHGAMFNYCTCDVSGDSAVATGNVIGKTFVKNSDGSVTIQKEILDSKIYDGNSYLAMATERVLKMCEKAKKDLIKKDICPAE